MHQDQPTGADLLVDALVAAGVDTVFGVPGDTGVALYDALQARQDDIRHVLARDERHAATMADASARLTNRVGVVEVSSGGGATFCVGGLGEPYAASVPLLVITSDIHDASRGSGALTELDLSQLYAAVTKRQLVPRRAAEVPAAVAEALRAALTGRPAPVALIVPENVLHEDDGRIGTVDPAPVRVPAARPEPDAAAILHAAEALRHARHPMLLAGSGVHASSAHDALAALVDAVGVPVATSVHGKGALAEDHPLSLGVVGANGAREYANAWAADVDVALVVGSRANATDTNSYTGPSRAATVVQIDVDRSSAGRNFPARVAVVGDAAISLERLGEALAGWAYPDRDATVAWIAEQRAAWQEAWRVERERAAAVTGLHPADVVLTLKESLPADVALVADCGTPTPFVAALWEVSPAGRQVLMARGHGPMGYAIPAAVGMAVREPGRTVAALTTDGSLTMAAGELATAAARRLPIVFVQLTNDAYGWIKMLQHLYHDKRYFGVDLDPVDAVAVAEAMGVRALRAERLSDLAEAVAEACHLGGPVYIEVRCPLPSEAPPPVAPWQEALSSDGPVKRPVY